MQVLPINQIKTQYPNQWVLVGNPQLDNSEVNGSILSKLKAGIVLFANKDKREIAYKAAGLRKSVDLTACVYTGDIPKRRWLLLRLSLQLSFPANQE
jgi:hypothetical protein